MWPYKDIQSKKNVAYPGFTGYAGVSSFWLARDFEGF